MKKKVLLFPSLLLLFYSCTDFAKLGKHEKHWAFSHPIVALKVKSIKKKCDPIYAEMKNTAPLDKYENGGKTDAFRHIFYMSAFSSRIKASKIRKLGKAHEKDNYIDFLNKKTEDGEYADSLSCVMDLRNNEIGIDLGKKNKKLNIHLLKDSSIYKINSGAAYFMKRNTDGKYTDCDGNILDLKKYSGKWCVPKCLTNK